MEYCFGRDVEISNLQETVKEGVAKAVIVKGPPGMGKSTILEFFVESLKGNGGVVRFEPVQTDSMDSLLAEMLDYAYEAADIKPGSFSGTRQNAKQWKALLDVVNIGDLVMSLRDDRLTNSRIKFARFLDGISQSLPNNGRAVFVIDPPLYLPTDSGTAWLDLFKRLPSKVCIVMGQRPDDEVVKNEKLGGLLAQGIVKLIPTDGLDVLNDEAIREFIEMSAGRLTGRNRWSKDELAVFSRLNGHPYAISATIDLFLDGASPDQIPTDPTPDKFANHQWKKVSSDNGPDAIRVVEALSVLDVESTIEIICVVTAMDEAEVKSVLNAPYPRTLIRNRNERYSIYHRILSDVVTNQIGDASLTQYHERAAAAYDDRLADARKEIGIPEMIWVTRLPFHHRKAGNEEQAALSVATDAARLLPRIGQYELAETMLNETLAIGATGGNVELLLNAALGSLYISSDREEQGNDLLREVLSSIDLKQYPRAVVGIMLEVSRAYLQIGDPRALTALETVQTASEALGDDLIIATTHSNFGNYYLGQNELKKAEEHFSKGRDISIRIGDLIGAANDIGSIGNIRSKQGQYSVAKDLMLDALNRFTESGFLEHALKLENNIAVVECQLEEYKEAIQRLERIIPEFKEYSMTSAEADANRMKKQIESKLQLEEFKNNARQAIDDLDISNE